MALGYSYKKLPTGWKCGLEYKGHRKSKTFKTKSAADNWARQITNLIDEGRYNGNDVLARPVKHSFLDRLSQMIPDLPTVTDKNKNRKQDYEHFSKIIGWHQLAKIEFDQVKTEYLKAFTAERRLFPGEYEIILEEAIDDTTRHPSNGKTW